MEEEVKFADIRDANGTSLQSYAELLAENAREHGFVVIIVLASKERAMVHTFTTMDGSVSNALIGTGEWMRAAEKKKGETLAFPAIHSGNSN